MTTGLLAISRTELFTIKRTLSNLANGDDAQELLADSYDIIDSILEKDIQIIIPEVEQEHCEKDAIDDDTVQFLLEEGELGEYHEDITAEEAEELYGLSSLIKSMKSDKLPVLGQKKNLGDKENG